MFFKWYINHEIKNAVVSRELILFDGHFSFHLDSQHCVMYCWNNLVSMVLERGTKVFPSEKSENISLEKTLRPLWILTCRTGILFDWMHPIVKKERRIVETLRLFSITAVFLLLSSVMIFELIQLCFGIGTMDRIHSIILNLIWFTTMPPSVMTMICYIFNKTAYITFFQDWVELEAELIKGKNICNSRDTHRFIYFAYTLIIIASLISLIIDIYHHPHGSFLLSSYSILEETITFPILAIIHISAIIFQWIFFSLNDLVPAFVFYHQSLALNCLEIDLITFFSRLSLRQNIIITEEKEDSSASIRLLWTRFENLALMVGRANQLFGRLILVGHASILFMMCILLYETLHHLTNDYPSITYGLVRMGSFVTNLVAFTFRIISCTLLSARVHQSSVRIKNTMAWYFSQYLDSISIRDRYVLVLFNSRLQQRDILAASPLDLYNITSSMLLSILGLIASYVIILLQSRWISFIDRKYDDLEMNLKINSKEKMSQQENLRKNLIFIC